MIRVIGAVVLAYFAGLLGACAMHDDARFRQLTGRSEEAVVDALGVPAKTYQIGSTKYLQYERESSVYYPTLRRTIDYRCRVTFKLETDRVVGYARSKDCDYLAYD